MAQTPFECGYKECNNQPDYCVEWWGLNQHGKDPMVVLERYSCRDPHHLIRVSHNDIFGGYPDEIQDASTYHALPKLLSAVRSAMDRKLDHSSIANLVRDADPHPNQGRLPL